MWVEIKINALISPNTNLYISNEFEGKINRNSSLQFEGL